MTKTTENAIEQTALEWLDHLGYEIANGPEAVEEIVNWFARQIVGGDA